MFTKGEWKATPFEVVTDDTTIADCVLGNSASISGKIRQPNMTSEEAQANTNLISAAPEMFEALYLANTQLRLWMKDHGEDIATKEAIKAINDALDKANGYWARPIMSGRTEAQKKADQSRKVKALGQWKEKRKVEGKQ